jgi:soluble lytic murein transglycosylase-like protein
MNGLADRRASKLAALFCALGFLVLTQAAAAAELAILRNGFTISHDHHVVMGKTTRLYLSADGSSFTDVATEDIASFEKDLSPPPTAPVSLTLPASSSPVRASAVRSATDLTQVVNSASAAYHLDPDLVNSVIHAESGFNSHAVSPKGARGLMQLMPSTADTLGVNDAFDPQENVGGGSRYLRELLERYNFDLVKALAAYNAGPQRVEQYNGVPPFHETRAYVAKIVHDYNRKKIAQEKAAAALQKHNKAVAASSSKHHPASTPVAHSTTRPAKTSHNITPQIAANASVGNPTR